MKKDYIEIARQTAEKLEKETPTTTNELQEKLEKVEKALEEARARVENATTEGDFEEAVEAQKVASDRVRFYTRQIENQTITARMPESVYDEIVSGVDETVRIAAATFRDRAKKALEELIEARKDFDKIASEADQALTQLDKQSQVLQARYPNHEQKRAGMPSIVTRDPGEWQRHATRYTATASRSKGPSLLFTSELLERGYAFAGNAAKLKK